MRAIAFIRDEIKEFGGLFLLLGGYIASILFSGGNAKWPILYICVTFWIGCIGEMYKTWSKEHPKEETGARTKDNKCAEETQ